MTDKVDKFAQEIGARWTATVDAILAVASSCAEADMVLNEAEKEELGKRLPFNASTYSKLKTIGRHKGLSDLKSVLPPSYSIIYEIAKMKDGHFSHAIIEGIIRPDVTRQELKEWLLGQRPVSTVMMKTELLVGTVKLKGQRPEEEVIGFAKELDSFCTSREAIVVRKLMPEERYGRAFDAFIEAQQAFVRRAVKKMVAEFERKKRRSKEPMGVWEEELRIDKFTTEAELQDILHHIGREDELEGLKRQAEAACDSPDPASFGLENDCADVEIPSHRAIDPRLKTKLRKISEAVNTDGDEVDDLS